MSGSDLFKMEGFGELEKALSALPERVERNVLRKALRAGGRKIIKRARQNIKDKTGTLSKSLGIKVKRTRKGSMVGIEVGARSGKKQKYDGFYAHMVEFGTRPHAIGRGDNVESGGKLTRGKQKGRQHPGMKARPFLRPAVDSTQSDVLNTIKEKMKDGIDSEAKKL